jgi:hypothetical protein
MAQPYLSVVAASRNDDHGGDPLRRTQIFVNCFARQCEKHRLPAEIILVDWNPVPDRPGLAAVLTLPPGTSYCSARVITVPTALHARIKYGEKLPFFQMIAKNAGIRRARGRFVLATNIDIIFSDELMAFLARQELDPRRQYRVDRYDIQAGLSENLTLDETLAYAWANPIRQNKRFGPAALVQHLYGSEAIRRECHPDPEVVRGIGGVTLRNEGGAWLVGIERGASIEQLHTNACGDFTLLSREGWEAIRGYGEWEAFSFNIDSMGIATAHYAGFEEVSLLPPCVCFHIEHSLGSGWTPEGQTRLFQRLRQAAILSPDWPVLIPLVDQMRRERRALEFNHAGWGLGDFDLPEQPLGDPAPLPPAEARPVARTVAAINPAYDLDRLTLVHERRLAESGSPAANDEDADVVQLFVPDAGGDYAEETSRVFRGPLRTPTTVTFRLDRYAHQHPLRLDPVARAGLVEISSVIYLDAGSGRTLMQLDGRDAPRCPVGGTARLVAPAPGAEQNPRPLYLLSDGDDPQLQLPTLAEPPLFPLLVLVELRFLPSV